MNEKELNEYWNEMQDGELRKQYQFKKIKCIYKFVLKDKHEIQFFKSTKRAALYNPNDLKYIYVMLS